MTGHHKVTIFRMDNLRGGEALHLPTGVKPFSAFVDIEGITNVVCREWLRDEIKETND